MKQLFAVIKKEFKAYIDHPMAYILAIVFLVLTNFLYFRTAFIEEIASMRGLFNVLPWVFVFFISALCMRTWAEEKREKTLSLLLSYPILVWKLVVGKFIATFLFVALVLALTLTVPITLATAGTVDWGVILAQYIGGLSMAAAMIAIAQWASSLSKNQVVAFIIAVAIEFAFIFVGLDLVVLGLTYPLNIVAQQLGMLAHYSSMTRGLLDLRDVLYFFSVSAVFLILSYTWLTRVKSNTKSKEWRTLQTATILLIVIAVVINLFGQSFTVRADLTNGKVYSLSPITKQVLRELDDTVRITMYRSKKLPTQIELVSRDIQDILSDYDKFGGGNVSLDVKFPDDNEDVLAELQQHGIPSIRFNVIEKDEFSLREGYLGVVLQYLDKKEVMPFVQSIQDIEYQITRDILNMQVTDKKKVGYVSDFGGLDLRELPEIFPVIQELYSLEQVKLEPTPEQETFTPEITDDIDVLVISGPTKPYSDAALAEVEKYISRGGRILWLIKGTDIDETNLSPSEVETGLEPFLAQQGITLQKNIVADLVAHETVNFNQGLFTFLLPYPFWPRAIVRPHVLAGNVNQMVMPWSSSIELEEGNDRVQPLITTSENGALIPTTESVNPNGLPNFDIYDKKEYIIGATVTDIPAVETDDTGRWVVISNTDFLSSQILGQSPNNAVIAINSIDWLAQNDALLTIRSKSGQVSRLIWKSENHKQFAKWFNTLGIPVFVAAFGGFWLFKRRRRHKKQS